MNQDSTLVAGIDEAGYGPRLGPLVVTLSAFGGDGLPSGDALDRGGNDGFREALAEALAPVAGRGVCGDRLRVDDSKKIYRGGKGFDELERSVLAFRHAARGCFPADLDDLLGRPVEGLRRCPWYGEAPLRLPLPRATPPERLSAAAEILEKTLAAAGIVFEGFACRVVPAPAFNRGVRREGNKAAFLARLVTGLIADAAPPAGTRRRARILVDKLGGRNSYAPLLRERFPAAVVTALEEGRPRSRYNLVTGDLRREISFVRSGDALHFPVALSSLFSKYVRELFMQLFNAYWTGLKPGLRPTAGYPVDARRFLDEIADTAPTAGIDRSDLVRER